LIFPATGVLLASGEDGHWVVSSSCALWLAGGGRRHHIRALGSVRMKSFVFEAHGPLELPGRSCMLHVTPLLREVMRSLARYGEEPPASRRVALLRELLLEKIIDRPSVPIELSERSEEHTSELQSRETIVCRPLLA